MKKYCFYREKVVDLNISTTQHSIKLMIEPNANRCDVKKPTSLKRKNDTISILNHKKLVDLRSYHNIRPMTCTR